MEVQLIFQPIMLSESESVPPTPTPFLFYGTYFKFASSSDGNDLPSPAPHIDMFLLRQHWQVNGSLMGNIISVDSIWNQVQLVPKYGSEAPGGLDSNNSMHIFDLFYMNNFTHKEMFHAILSYQ